MTRELTSLSEIKRKRLDRVGNKSSRRDGRICREADRGGLCINGRGLRSSGTMSISIKVTGGFEWMR
jgi:hypothetical protein